MAEKFPTIVRPAIEYWILREFTSVKMWFLGAFMQKLSIRKVRNIPVIGTGIDLLIGDKLRKIELFDLHGFIG